MQGSYEWPATSRGPAARRSAVRRAAALRACVPCVPCVCRVCSSSRGHPLQADERVEQDAAHRREECRERRLRHDLAQEAGSGLGLGLG